ncbi:MAG: phospho-N-acetylmuramoyl-pentapeptide-transferase [Oscillospiraceae bacterium]|nr:phospho-N-acetylmuramoyl-pentapeptide-transferase [Oscillospiraceae bacterium]
MLTKMLLSFVIALVFSTAFGKIYIPWLLKQKFGQEIKEIGPNWHMNKSGTPTMGGVMFIFALVLVCLTVGFASMTKGIFVHIFVLLFALVFGFIGFLDDWQKIKNRHNTGLSAKVKFALQLAAALVFIAALYKTGHVNSNALYIPFFNTTLYLNSALYFVLAAFIIVGTVNAVNITDGIDGLASGSSLPVFLFYAVIAFIGGTKYLELGMIASAMIGGLLGFLVYNFNPAKCFMGDTGSLFLGGLIAAMAFAYDMPLILVTIGIVFIIETLSAITQVTYFKLTHGKRIFKMAPFHHHLEMGGWTGKKWKEKEIFALFTCVSLVFAIISVFGVYHKLL